MKTARLLALALLAGLAAGAAASGIPLDQRIDGLFAPYRTSSDRPAPPVWTRPVFSSQVTPLIAAWRKTVQPGEIGSALEEGDWFCQCQDWDGPRFRILSRSYRTLPDGRVEADISFDLGGDTRRERIVFRREGERWKVADLFSPAFPKGLVAALKAEIAAGRRG